MFSLPSPLQKLDLSVFGVDQKVYVKRDDLIHTIVSGNKWRKLKQNLDYFFKSSKKGIVSLGGAYSSHVLALSYLCKQNDIPLVLLIRGQRPKQLSNILEQCIEHKSKLIFLDRTDYSDSSYVSNLVAKNWTNYFFIPEGGANKWGILGCQEIINELGLKFNEIYCEVGSGATLAGLSAACSEQQIVKGIVVLKGAHDIDMDIKTEFKGLPAPVNALFIVSLPLLIENPLLMDFRCSIESQAIFLAIIIISCILMNNNIPFFSLISISLKNERFKILVLLILSIPLFSIFYFASFPMIILIYILLNLLVIIGSKLGLSLELKRKN